MTDQESHLSEVKREIDRVDIMCGWRVHRNVTIRASDEEGISFMDKDVEWFYPRSAIRWIRTTFKAQAMALVLTSMLAGAAHAANGREASGYEGPDRGGQEQSTGTEKKKNWAAPARERGPNETGENGGDKGRDARGY